MSIILTGSFTLGCEHVAIAKDSSHIIPCIHPVFAERMLIISCPDMIGTNERYHLARTSMDGLLYIVALIWFRLLTVCKLPGHGGHCLHSGCWLFAPVTVTHIECTSLLLTKKFATSWFWRSFPPVGKYFALFELILILNFNLWLGWDVQKYHYPCPPAFGGSISLRIDPQHCKSVQQAANGSSFTAANRLIQTGIG
jgi:hypothetical protein